MKTIGIALALGDIYEAAGSGRLHMPLDGGIARLDGLIRQMTRDRSSLIVATAGYSKHEPLVPQPDRMVSLADQLARYVRINTVLWEDRVLAKPLCWSTRNEIRNGIKLAQRAGFAGRNEPVRVLIASNWLHLIRIRLYTSLYMPKSWKVQFTAVDDRFSFRSHMSEFPKIIRDMLLNARILRRARRIRSARQMKR
ncbi:MAG: hypothetical protein JWO73_248 [Candidatus Taylorbacteria bacterium]|nr:hypothetical protein [Candidatus Taylorbacteria bacterium]